MTRRTPYTITETKTLIEISEQTYSAMARPGATKDEQKAIALINALWESGTDPDEPYGVSIPTLGGWSGPEMLKLEPAAEQGRLMAAAVKDVIAQICDIKGCTPEEANTYLQKLAQAEAQAGGEPLELTDDMVALLPCVESMIAIKAVADSVDHATMEHTALMRRAIPTWSTALTQALPSTIRDALSELVEQEYAGINTGKQSPPPAQPTNSEPKPKT